MRVNLFLFAAFTASTSADVLGGWESAQVTDANTLLLNQALQANTGGNMQQVCYKKVCSLQTQQVSGKNFLFTVSGCSVTDAEGKCSDETLKSCQLKEYDVTVYQNLENKLEITKIQPHVNGASPGSTHDVCADEPSPAVDLDKYLLTQALTSGNYSTSVGTTRVCYTKLESAQYQGIQQAFVISGCNVTVSEGECSQSTLNNCQPQEFDVLVYQQQPNSFEVMAIQLHNKAVLNPFFVSTVPGPSTRNVVPGGVEPTIVSDDYKQLLKSALTTGNFSEWVGDARVCYKEVTSVKLQLGSGINYFFTLSGCSVTVSEGECSAQTLTSCQLTEYDVTVYQRLSNALEVTTIQLHDTGVSPSPTPEQHIPGLYQPAQMTDESINLLKQALSGTNFADWVGNTRVCYKEVEYLSTQKVAGTNFMFTISGCIVQASEGKCSTQTLTSCQLNYYNVLVFESLKTEPLEVTAIVQIQYTPPSPVQDADQASK